MRLIPLCLLAILSLTQHQAAAGESRHGTEITCGWVGDSPSDATIEEMRKALAQDDWPLIRHDIWMHADPAGARGSRWHDAAKQEKLNLDLVEAAMTGDDKAALETIAKGADVNLQPEVWSYKPPLLWAAACGHLSTVKLLIEHGADVNISGHYYEFDGSGAVENSTALMWAAFYANDDIVEFLLKHGADPNIQEHATSGAVDDFIHWQAVVATKKKLGDTALHQAGSAKTTEILLRYGADPNFVTWDGTTALMNAAASGDAAECLLLLAHGASATLRDADDRTASDLARSANHPDVAILIDRWIAEQKPR